MFRSELKIQVRLTIALAELGLDARAGVDKAVLAFLDWAEGIAVRWIQMPAGVLLFVAVPGDPCSGACYIYERRRGVFYLLELADEPNGQLTTDDFERLLRGHRLLNLARRPWSLRAESRDPASNGAFACAA
ncbi:MAG: hypothetical protein ACRD4Q_09020 [Candidatus Acidiferrales bacterium]